MSSYSRALEKQKRVRCFMDGIDWQHHLEHDAKGTRLYPSRRALDEDSGHDLRGCGVVEVEVRLIEWIVPQDLSKYRK